MPTSNNPPSSLPEWATNATATGVQITEPDSEKKSQGWMPGERPPAQVFNWWMQLVYKWVKYLSGLAGQAVPLRDGFAAVGTSTCFAREDHVHPTLAGSSVPLSDGIGAVGDSLNFARANHVHPTLAGISAPLSDSKAAKVGVSGRFAREDHVHPSNGNGVWGLSDQGDDKGLIIRCGRRMYDSPIFPIIYGPGQKFETYAFVTYARATIASTATELKTKVISSDLNGFVIQCTYANGGLAEPENITFDWVAIGV